MFVFLHLFAPHQRAPFKDLTADSRRGIVKYDLMLIQLTIILFPEFDKEFSSSDAQNSITKCPRIY